MIRLTITISLVLFIVGCDSISTTEIVVNKFPTDTRGSKQVTLEIISAVENAAEQFGLCEEERTKEIVAFNDWVAGENPRIALVVFEPCEFPVVIRIVEMYVGQPTHKHRNIANAVVSNLRVNKLDAVVISKTPAFWEREGLILVAAFSILILLLILRERKQPGTRWKTGG